MKLSVACDGSCLGNPGPGGWAWVICEDIYMYNGFSKTTNNICELISLINFLEFIYNYNIKVISSTGVDNESISKTPHNNFEENIFQKLAAFAQNQAIYEIDIILDSQYVLNSATKWISAWKGNGWRTTSRKPVANLDLMQKLDNLLEYAKQNKIKLNFVWTKGHAGHGLNELADSLARKCALKYKA